MTNKFKTISSALGGAILGIAGHHYAEKWLFYREYRAEEIAQTERDKVLIEVKINLNSESYKLQSILDKINGKNKFTGESELKSLDEYLDTLSLLQELAFLHIIYIITIFFIVWNIYSVIFANEILKYFNIEEKYPRWNKFFVLRKKYQKYYLGLNLSFFIVLSLFILGLDLLTLFVNVK